jgi:hypothetical protein
MQMRHQQQSFERVLRMQNAEESINSCDDVMTVQIPQEHDTLAG